MDRENQNNKFSARRATPLLKIKRSTVVLALPQDRSKWPNSKTIFDSQFDASEHSPTTVLDDDVLVLSFKKKKSIPKDDHWLKLKLLTIAHTKDASPRGGGAIAVVFQEQFVCNGTTVDAKSFISDCLLCI